MKKLWKYLSTLGLMLVACLCLGVGLKASDVSFGAMPPGGESSAVVPDGGTACVYIANGKHEMKGGTIGGKAYGIYISGGTFTMSGGTISNCSSYGVYLSSGTFNYSAGTISDEIYLSSSRYITLTKAPTSTLKIRLSSTSSGTRVAYLSGISSLTSTQLSYLNVVNMPSGYRLEVSNGYVVLAQSVTNYTVTISAGTGGSVSRTSVSVPSGTTFSTSGRTLSFGNGTSVTATANTGYSFDYWSPSSGTITSSRTIYAYFSKNQTTTNYTVTISAGTGGSVSTRSVSVPSGTTFSTSGSTLKFSNGTNVTATANSGYSFSYWSPSSGTITSSTTIYAYFSKNSTPTPPDPQGEIYVGLDPDRRLTALERAILIVLNNGSTINDAINDGSFEAYMNEVFEIEFGVNGDQAFFEEYGISYKYFEAPRKDIIDSYGVDIYFPLGSINGGTTSIEVSNYRYSYMSSYPGQLVTTSRADVLVIYEGDDPSVLTGSTLTHLSTDMSRACDAVDRFCTYNDVTPDHVYIGSEQALTGTISGLWSMPVAIDSGYLDAADDYTLEDFFNQMRDRGYSWFWLSDEGYDVDWYSFMFLTAEFNNAYGSTIRNDLQYLRYTYPEFASAKWRYLQKGY